MRELRLAAVVVAMAQQGEEASPARMVEAQREAEAPREVEAQREVEA
jgi:hypothetical protein